MLYKEHNEMEISYVDGIKVGYTAPGPSLSSPVPEGVSTPLNSGATQPLAGPATPPVSCPLPHQTTDLGRR